MRGIELTPAELEELSAEVLGDGGSLSFRARGGSMLPFIRDGDLVTIRPVAPGDLRIGDVAFYRAPRARLVVHRVVGRAVREGLVVLTTRGDSSEGEEEGVEAGDVLGRVASVTRGAKVHSLDSGVWLWGGRTWVALSGSGLVRATRFARRAVGGSLRRLQGVKTYRALVRGSIGKLVRYRIATAEDAEGLALLYGRHDAAAFGPSPDESSLLAGQGRVHGETLVARLGGHVAGAAFLTWYPEEAPGGPGWWLFGMVVRPRFRGAGMGEGLARLALERASSRGATRLSLLVLEDNRPALDLYRKAGFRPDFIPCFSEGLEEEARREGRRRVLLSRTVYYASRLQVESRPLPRHLDEERRRREAPAVRLGELLHPPDDPLRADGVDVTEGPATEGREPEAQDGPGVAVAG